MQAKLDFDVFVLLLVQFRTIFFIWGRYQPKFGHPWYLRCKNTIYRECLFFIFSMIFASEAKRAKLIYWECMFFCHDRPTDRFFHSVAWWRKGTGFYPIFKILSLSIINFSVAIPVFSVLQHNSIDSNIKNENWNEKQNFF